ncbi:hypothetical protein Avbf_08713 [Armadillidium vulgare]|nr:hypothetical protein Avbf_08713 [Armadillidium vulgare]
MYFFFSNIDKLINIDIKIIDILTKQPVVTMDEDSKKILMTWVGRKVNVKNVRKSLKELVTLVGGLLPPGIIYSCCEQYDTYLNGGLYPVLHISTDQNLIQNKLSSKEFLPINAIGESNVIEQAVYTEIASITPPGVKSGRQSVFAVAAFRSIEEYVPEILVREWKWKLRSRLTKVYSLTFFRDLEWKDFWATELSTDTSKAILNIQS